MSLEPKNEPVPNVICVEMDDRAFLLPEARNIVQLKFVAEAGSKVALEFVYAHNVSHLPPSRVTLQYEDAKDFCTRLIDAVYRAQTQNFISDSAHIAITLVPNGYIWMIEEGGKKRQFYMSTSVVWRVCNALYRIVDIQSPVASN